MSDIPQAMVDAAQAVLTPYGIPDHNLRIALLAAMAEGQEPAKLAERQSCAKLARTFSHHALWPIHCGIEYGWTPEMEALGMKLAEGIAKAIEGRTRREEIERKFGPPPHEGEARL